MTAIILFLSVTLIILGPGVGKAAMNGIEYAAPYDGTVSYAPEGEKWEIRNGGEDSGSGEAARDPMAYLKRAGFDIGEYSDRYVDFWFYNEPSAVAGFLTGEETGVPDREVNGSGTLLTIIGSEDYNRLLVLQGLEPLELGEDEFAVSYSFPDMEKPLKDFARSPRPLFLGDAELTLARDGIRRCALENVNLLIDLGTLVGSPAPDRRACTAALDAEL